MDENSPYHPTILTSTAKVFKTFKPKLSKAVRNISQEDLKKLTNMKDGRMQPHPNTFILKKLGISSQMYEKIRYAAFRNRMSSKDNLDKAIESINTEQGNSFASGMLGGTMGSAFVTLIATIFNKHDTSDLPRKVDATFNRLAQDEVISLKTTISYLKDKTEPFLNLKNGYNYLKAFGLPITKADWDNLSEDLKQSWSPFNIKPPITNEARQEIAKSIKQKEFSPLEMCYDFG